MSQQTMDLGNSVGAPLLTEQDGAVYWITFNRPSRLNAATRDMEQRLVAACNFVNGTPDIRVVVLQGVTGSKPAFMAGNDIGEFQALESAEDVRRTEAEAERTLSAIENLRVPVIAAINGAVIGQGALLAACSDIVVAGPKVRFGFPIARTVGNCLSVRNLSRLTDYLGLPLTKSMIMRAQLLNTEDLARVGAVVATSPSDQALREVSARIAVEMAQLAPLTLSNTKKSLLQRRSEITDNEELVISSYLSRDSREAVSAFLEKRPPLWEGR
jgi:enoyl-CoA hydratase